MLRTAPVFLGLILLVSCGDETRRPFDLSEPSFTAPEPFTPYIGGPDELPGGGYGYNLTILYTNDIHDQILPVDEKLGGLARHATLMNLVREQAAGRGVEVLAANAGDCWEGTLFYERDGGATLFQLLELLDYDVIQIGNHDHQFGVQRLYDVLQTAFPNLDQSARFLFGNVNPADMYAAGSGPYAGTQMYTPATVAPEVIDAFENGFADLAGNVDPALFDAPLANSKLFNQTVFFDKAGVRVGIFGIDTAEILYTIVPSGDLLLMPDDYAEGVVFYDEVSSTYASSMIDYLDDPDGDPATDDGADVIIAVTHIGLGVDRDVARAAVGQNGRRIDVIVGGHSHTRINRAVAIDHGGGQQTVIVQAGARGEFLGRLDLMVDTAANRSTIRNVELLEVVPEIPEDPDAAALINGVMNAPGGINQFYDDPYRTVVAESSYWLSTQVQAAHAIGGLTAGACLNVGNAEPFDLALDLMLVTGFAYRSDLCDGPVTIADVQALLPLHVPGPSGLNSDAVHFVDFPGGLREAANLADFPDPLPNLVDITTLEYFLEIVFGLNDVIVRLAASGVGGGTEVDLGSILGIINGLQWAGLDVVVDAQAPPLERIDPATVFVNGVPLVGNEDRTWRLGISSIVAELVLPFVSALLRVEDPPGSGILRPFPDYDPIANGSSLIIWEALREELQALQVLRAAEARVPRDGPRTMAPDLTFDHCDAVISPAPLAGQIVTISIPVLNLGETATTGAQIDLTYDPTPGVVADNPDGLTDTQTGFAFSSLGNAAIGPVPAFAGGVPGTTVVAVDVTIPAGLSSGRYPVYATIQNVVSADPVRPEQITANNGGTFYPIIVEIP